MICPNCKKELADGSKYCYQCGAIFDEKPKAYAPQNNAVNMNDMNPYFSPQQPPQKPQKSGNTLKIGFIALGAFLIIGIIITAILLAVSPPSKNTSNSIGTDNTINITNSKPQISEVTMASSIDEITSEAIEIVEYFSPDTPMIYAVCEMSGSKNDTITKAEWFYLETNESLGSYEYSPGFGEGTFHFSASKPDNGWPIGKYKIELFLDGIKANECYFEVREDGNSGNVSASASSSQVGSEKDTLSQDILGKWQADYENEILAFEFFSNGTCSILSQVGNGPVDESIGPYDLEGQSIYFDGDKSNMMGVEVIKGDILTFTQDGEEITFYSCGRFNFNPVYEIQTDIQDFRGDYVGSYSNNSGDMNLVIRIDQYNSTDALNYYDINAEFHFSPSNMATSDNSGVYAMIGGLEIVSDNVGYVWLEGMAWLSNQPSENYNMLNLEGWIDLNQGTFNGAFDRDYKPEFYLIKE